ncbi:cell division protein FtsK, partial [Streptococcus pyogenes]
LEELDNKVDLETGEILDVEPAIEEHALPLSIKAQLSSEILPEDEFPIHLAQEEILAQEGDQEEAQVLEDVVIDFKPKHGLAYKLPT